MNWQITANNGVTAIYKNHHILEAIFVFLNDNKSLCMVDIRSIVQLD